MAHAHVGPTDRPAKKHRLSRKARVTLGLFGNVFSTLMPHVAEKQAVFQQTTDPALRADAHVHLQDTFAAAKTAATIAVTLAGTIDTPTKG
jgi:hypothetical protein